MAENSTYTIGLDFGSNSVRCLILDIASGRECAVAVWNYSAGRQGVLLDPENPHVARQSPADYLEGLQRTVIEALAMAREEVAGFSAENVIGIGVDTTGSTPLPVDDKLRPLAFQERFRDNLNAQAWMWKDHSAMAEAERITELAREMRPQYLAKCGGVYSSEWFFAKLWHCLQTDPEVFDAAFAWLEFADFIPATLAGIDNVENLRIGVCAAGHKAMFNREWGGYPDAEFLDRLDPKLGALRQRLPAQAWCAEERAGGLSAEWAERLGLADGIAVAVGAFDAHLGAVGAGIADGRMVKIIGTSTCDCLIAPNHEPLPDIPGVCGVVDGSIMKGYYTVEAGQSAVGDIFNWFVDYICQGDAEMFKELTEPAGRLRPGQSGLLGLDWHNGNRTILVDARLTGLMVGFNLHTTRAEIYRGLIESTAFGARRILDRIEESGVTVREVVNCGGIAEKNPLFMQIYADILGRPMKVSASSQTCALGSAIMGAVAAGSEAGGYARPEAAQAALCKYKKEAYRPLPEHRAVYDRLYRLYCQLHDSFGLAETSFDHSGLMKELLEIKGKG